MGKRAVGRKRTNPTHACGFCKSADNDEIEYGPMYTIGNITCHYFCVLLSTKLVQRGKDKEGILGFLFSDIKSELEWAKSKRCIYCHDTGATIFCCHRSCRLMFHLPCGLKNGALPLFYKTFQTFCVKHRLNQTIPKRILSKFNRMVTLLEKIQYQQIYTANDVNKIMQKLLPTRQEHISSQLCKTDVCFICYEEIIFSENMNDKFWPPCCKTNAYFHRKCLSRMAVSAGKYYIRCPLCNNVAEFLSALLAFGIYIPEQDAAWERENGAFNELLQRPNECMADVCKCPKGRSTDIAGSWNLIICNTCGSEAVHAKCINLDKDLFECHRCIKTVSTVERFDINNSLINHTPNETLSDIQENNTSCTMYNKTNLDKSNNILKENFAKVIKLETCDGELIIKTDCRINSSSMNSSKYNPNDEKNISDFKINPSRQRSMRSTNAQNKNPKINSDRQVGENIKTSCDAKVTNISIRKDLYCVNKKDSGYISDPDENKDGNGNEKLNKISDNSPKNNYDYGKRSIVDYFAPIKTDDAEIKNPQSVKFESPLKKKCIKLDVIHSNNTLHKYFQINESQKDDNRNIPKKKCTTTSVNHSTMKYSIKKYFITENGKSIVKKKKIKKVKLSVKITERKNSFDETICTSSVSVSTNIFDNSEFKQLKENFIQNNGARQAKRNNRKRCISESYLLNKINQENAEHTHHVKSKKRRYNL